MARLERDSDLDLASAAEALERLDELASGWVVVEASSAVKEQARRLLRVHDLRAAEALQLAAAVLASETRPPTLPFWSLDDRLLVAAAREGFPVGSRPRPRSR